MKTADGVVVVGVLTVPDSTVRGAALLLHMMPLTKESWRALAAALASRGLMSLAIDLRGHGESVKAEDGRLLDYINFTDADHQATQLDIAAAASYLRAAMPTGASGRIVMAGASIGANLSLRYASEHHDEVTAVAALSPGLAYRGITTPDAVRAMGSDQALWLGASRDDAHGSWETVHELAGLRRAVLFEAERAGHGTDMFKARPELVEEVAQWLAQNLK